MEPKTLTKSSKPVRTVQQKTTYETAYKAEVEAETAPKKQSEPSQPSSFQQRKETTDKQADKQSEQLTWLKIKQVCLENWEALVDIPVALIFASFLLVLGIVQLNFQIGQSLFRSYVWMEETKEQQKRVERLENDVSMLQQAEKAAKDPKYLEKLARCQGFVKKDELIVVNSNSKFSIGENCDVLRVP